MLASHQTSKIKKLHTFLVTGLNGKTKSAFKLYIHKGSLYMLL